MTAKKATAKLNFEQSLTQLTELVEQLEEGELSLEQALKTYEKGIKLSKGCQQALQQAEQKVMKLSEDKDGQLSLTDFDEPA